MQVKVKKKVWVSIVTAIILLMPNSGVAQYQDGIYRDVGAGYNDEVIVTVTVGEGKIDSLQTQNKSGAQANEYLQKATEGLSAAIIQMQGSTGVEAVSGATGSSQSILDAMEGIYKQASALMGGEPQLGSSGAQGSAVLPRPTVDPKNATLFHGLGQTTNFRIGPGKDAQGNQIYSFNIVFASVLFDKEGKIVDAQVDIYEVLGHNANKEKPHFEGWPDQVEGITEESAAQMILGWQTKRERGSAYGMNPNNDWYQQMDFYESWMIGRTTEELRTWFNKFTSNQSGKPLTAAMTGEEDKAKYDALTDTDKAQLQDVVSGATMSLSDDHGFMVEAIEEAYENRTPVVGTYQRE